MCHYFRDFRTTIICATIKIANAIGNGRSLKLRENGTQLPSLTSSMAKPTANERHPGGQVVPGRSGSGQGAGWVREGEARGVRITSEQHHPTPPYQLTPPPLRLGHCSGGSPPPPSFPHTAVLHGTPEIEPQVLGFGFLTQTSPPDLALSNAWPPPPPPSPCHLTTPTTSQHHCPPLFHMARP